MKVPQITFFSPDQNIPGIEKSPVLPTGYISRSGRLVFPRSTIKETGIEPAAKFKIGTDVRRRKFEHLYLVPTQEENAFAFRRQGPGLVLDVPQILKACRIGFENARYAFTVEPITYEGSVAYTLSIRGIEPTHPYS